MNSAEKHQWKLLIKQIVDKYGNPANYPSIEEVKQIADEFDKYEVNERTDAILKPIIKKYVSYDEEFEVTAYDTSDTNNTLDEILDILDDKKPFDL